MTTVQQMAFGVFQIQSQAQKVYSDMLALTSELAKFLVIRNVAPRAAYEFAESVKSNPTKEIEFSGSGFGSAEINAMKETMQLISKGWHLHCDLEKQACQMKSDFFSLVKGIKTMGEIAPHETDKKF